MPSNARNALGLLRVYDTVMQELIETGVLRSRNNPVADFAEYLCCEAFDWQLNTRSTKGHDAVDINGVRYEIKARRMSASNQSRQLSAIRKIDERNFDFLVGILFDANFSIVRAAQIPWSTVRECGTFVASTNSTKFMLRDAVWDIEGVSDITEHLRGALS